MKHKHHLWTENVPAILLYPTAAIIATLGALLIPTAVIDRVGWMHTTRYYLGEIFDE